MKPQLKNEVITSIQKHRHAHAGNKGVAPKDLDELIQLARKMLMDEQLEVSKVKPLFWSMVETYVDRFQVFPFDVVKTLHSYLELIECSSEEMHAVVKTIEEMHVSRYGKAMKQTTKLLAEKDTLEDEIKNLRDSLKYASMVDVVET